MTHEDPQVNIAVEPWAAAALETQFAQLTEPSSPIVGGDPIRVEIAREVLAYLRSAKLKSRTGRLLRPLEVLSFPEDLQLSEYMFSQSGDWFKFHVGVERAEIEFRTDNGTMAHLTIAFNEGPRICVGIFSVGVVMLDDDGVTRKIYPIVHISP
jgi:hypothetical protein